MTLLKIFTILLTTINIVLWCFVLKKSWKRWKKLKSWSKDALAIIEEDEQKKHSQEFAKWTVERFIDGNIASFDALTSNALILVLFIFQLIQLILLALAK